MGKINGLSPIKQVLSQKVQGAKDSRGQVVNQKITKSLKSGKSHSNASLEIYWKKRIEYIKKDIAELKRILKALISL